MPFSPIPHHPQLLGSTIKKAVGLGNEVRYSSINMGNYLLIRKRKSEWQSRTSTGGFLGVMRVLISNGKRFSVGKSAVFLRIGPLPSGCLCTSHHDQEGGKG